MKVGIVSFKHPGIYPVMQRKEYNPVLGVNIPALGVKEAKHLTGVTINFNADPKDIESVTLYSGTSDATHIGTAVFTPAKPDKASGPLTFTGDMPLKSGNNWIWVSVKLSKEANLDHTLTASAEASSSTANLLRKTAWPSRARKTSAMKSPNPET